uniref:Uncharacterized protein n=1 Tax=Panagrellus redivivus TaxID=6233 RepID=A0A7E4ULN8_PANRE
MKSFCHDKVPQDIERVRASWLVVVLVGRRVPTNALGAGALFPKSGRPTCAFGNTTLERLSFLTSQGRREERGRPHSPGGDDDDR